MKILGILILYKTDKTTTAVNIEQYVRYLDKLIVWINSPNYSVVEFKELFQDKDYGSKLIYHYDGKNSGLSKPLNYAQEIAVKDKYDYLLTMDQDSFVMNFEYYLNKITELDVDCAIFCQRINDLRLYDNEVVRYHDLINSGTIYSIEALKTIGCFNKYFFVDSIDTEYCLRAEMFKVPIYLINNAKITQVFGSPRLVNFLGRKIMTNNYSGSRIKEIISSNIYMFKEFNGKYKFYIGKRLFYLWGINLLARIILLEPDKKLKLKSWFCGYKDGLKLKVKPISNRIKSSSDNFI